MIIMVTFRVVYHQDSQIMFQILQNIQHNDITFKGDSFILIYLMIHSSGFILNNTKLYSKQKEAIPP